MAPAGRCFAFGGVKDEEGEEDLCGTFHNDVYNVDLEKTSWKQSKFTVFGFPRIRCKKII
jgi:hypothetical protein